MKNQNINTSQEYKYGFTTDIENIRAPKGLNENSIKFISKMKKEPRWMLDWRLKAYNRLKNLKEPNWQKPKYPKIDYQDLYYYSAPKSASNKPKSLDEVDPKLLETYKKLGIPLNEQKKLAGVAVDAVFDSVSVATTYKEELTKKGIIFCSISEAIQKHPDLVKKIYWFCNTNYRPLFCNPKFSSFHRRFFCLHPSECEMPNGAFDLF